MIGSSLKETSYQTGLSITSCFYLRHKIYKALEEAQASSLEGEMQLDTTFLDIEFKGLRITPRLIKGSKVNPKSKDLPCVKDPQTCISTAADEKARSFFLFPGMEGSHQRNISCISAVTLQNAGSYPTALLPLPNSARTTISAASP